MCKIRTCSSVFVVVLCMCSSVAYCSEKCEREDYQGSFSAVWCVDSICSCACVCVYACTCLWVLGRLEVLVGLIEKDHCQRNWETEAVADYLEPQTHTETEAVSHALQKCAVWFRFYFRLLCRALFLFHHLLCLLYSLILSCGVWLPVPVPSLWLTGLDDVMAIMRMCP